MHRTVFCFFLLSYMMVYLHRDRMFLFPLLNIIQPATPSSSPMAYEEVYFENEMGAWVYPPLHPLTDERILVYFNGNAGNVSTRVSNIKAVQHLMPGHTVYNLEYPGYGISSHMGTASLGQIIQECIVACESILRNHPNVDALDFWGESIGAVVQARVFEHMPSLVRHVYQLNGISCLGRVLSTFLPNLTHGLFVPLLPDHDTAAIYTRSLGDAHHLWVVHARNDEVVSDQESKRLFITLKHKHPDRVHYLSILGKHNGALLGKENQEAIAAFLRQ